MITTRSTGKKFRTQRNIGTLLLAFLSLHTIQAQQNSRSVCSVSAGADHVNCQQPIQLQGQPLSPGSDYIYSWAPANLLTNPNSLNAFGPAIGPGVHNQQFVLTMTDTVTGCVATDTVIVSAYLPLFGPHYFCGGDSLVLDFGPGATQYFWQNFIDQNNVSNVINQTTQTFTATQPGTYIGFAIFPNCGAITSVINVIDTCTVTSSCSVDAGPDSTFCQQPVQLQGQPLSPGSDYIYSWSPANLLTNPNSLNAFGPSIGPGFQNQQFVLTMTDTVTNCVATDTVIVSSYLPLFGPHYFCGGDSLVLDFGPGGTQYFWQNFIDSNNVSNPINQNTQTLTVTQAGTYIGFAIFPSCVITSVVNVIDTCNTSNICGVDAGPDTTFCQIQGQLQATPASPGNYTYSWAPAYGLDNPNSQNPNVVYGVNNQQYVVTMTDTANNCTATDTVIVSAYYFHIDTLYLCNGNALTYNLGPGATQYSVQYTDTMGNGQFQLFTNNAYLITQPAQYIFIGLYPGCGALTSLVTVYDSCNVPVGNVWPGDCNYDLTANMADVLNIGIGYNTTGPLRPNASNQWYAQPMADWSQNFVNCNYKHADADGNGTINVNDTLPVALNYGLTHPYLNVPELPFTASTPTLQLVANYDTCGLQTRVTVDIRMGDNSIPVDSLYGVSFRLSFESNLIDTIATGLTFGGSWLGSIGSNMIGFQKPFRTPGVIDVCEVRNNQLNHYNGNGSIGSFQIVTTDNLSGINVLHLNVGNVTAVTLDGTVIPVNLIPDSVIIDPSVPAGIHNNPAPATWQVYPNPANEVITIKGNYTSGQIELVNMLGQVILAQPVSTSITRLDVNQIQAGIYFLRIKNSTGTHTEKITITR